MVKVTPNIFIAAKIIREGWKQPETLKQLINLFIAMEILCDGSDTELFERFVDKFWQNFNRA